MLRKSFLLVNADRRATAFWDEVCRFKWVVRFVIDIRHTEKEVCVCLRVVTECLAVDAK